MREDFRPKPLGAQPPVRKQFESIALPCIDCVLRLCQPEAIITNLRREWLPGENHMKLYSWNVNGVRAAQKKGFLDWLHAAQPDVLTIQETKAHPEQLDDALRQPEGYHAWWVSAERKGYSGVGLFSKTEPQDIKLGLGIEKFDSEGRTIIADYGDFTLMTTYLPNGGRDHSRVPYKMEYKEAFLDYANNLRADGKKVVFTGDINTAHNEIDLARPKQNTKTTGFLREERDWIDKVVEQGYIDTYRQSESRARRRLFLVVNAQWRARQEYRLEN